MLSNIVRLSYNISSLVTLLVCCRQADFMFDNEHRWLAYGNEAWAAALYSAAAVL